VTHGAHTGRRRRKIPYKKDASVHASAPNSAINVTPLVDVCLVLLIIFMVVTPMLGAGKDVKLPVLTTADAHKEGDQVFVSVNSDGLWINQDLYDSRKDFVEALKVEVKIANGKATASNYEGPILFVKGDSEMDWGRARVVMEWLKELELSGIALVVDLEELAPAG
jgi:biopolymer transport protein TolR